MGYKYMWVKWVIMRNIRFIHRDLDYFSRVGNRIVVY